jgi:hypothetical protein
MTAFICLKTSAVLPFAHKLKHATPPVQRVGPGPLLQWLSGSASSGGWAAHRKLREQYHSPCNNICAAKHHCSLNMHALLLCACWY